MKFVLIDPKNRTVERVDADNLDSALTRVGLQPGRVDFGALTQKISYVVYEFGLFINPPTEQSYCTIGTSKSLIAGPCVLFAVDEDGDTVDMPPGVCAADVHFFLGVNDVELAIQLGEVRRPEIRVNGILAWQWPMPAPSGMVP